MFARSRAIVLYVFAFEEADEEAGYGLADDEDGDSVDEPPVELCGCVSLANGRGPVVLLSLLMRRRKATMANRVRPTAQKYMRCCVVIDYSRAC